jgi:superfamily II DNA helicase RecQ
MVVNLPTGCGKSILFFLYAFQYPSKAVLVVVPTISLQVDLVKRSLSFGVSATGECGEWDCGKILFVTPEAVDTPSFYRKLMELGNRGVVGRLFVDEAHYYFLQGDFRPSCKKLSLLRVCGQPITCLSATMTAACVAYLSQW